MRIKAEDKLGGRKEQINFREKSINHQYTNQKGCKEIIFQENTNYQA